MSDVTPIKKSKSKPRKSRAKTSKKKCPKKSAPSKRVSKVVKPVVQRNWKIRCRICNRYKFIVKEDDIEASKEFPNVQVCSSCVDEVLSSTYNEPLTPKDVQEGLYIWASIKTETGARWSCMFSVCFISMNSGIFLFSVVGFIFEIEGSSMWVAATRPFEGFHQTVLNDSRITKKLLQNERYHKIGLGFGNDDQLWPFKFEKVASGKFSFDEESADFEVWLLGRKTWQQIEILLPQLPPLFHPTQVESVLFGWSCRWPHASCIENGTKLIENKHSDVFKRHYGNWITLQMGDRPDNKAAQSIQKNASARSKKYRGRCFGMIRHVWKRSEQL